MPRKNQTSTATFRGKVCQLRRRTAKETKAVKEEDRIYRFDERISDHAVIRGTVYGHFGPKTFRHWCRNVQ